MGPKERDPAVRQIGMRPPIVHADDPTGNGRRPLGNPELAAVRARPARARVVEFIGPTGAGKTTLARAIARGRLIDPPPRMWTELITNRPGLGWVEDPHVINLLADVAAMRASFSLSDLDRRFVRFAFDRLRRHAPSMLSSLNYRRNVIRRVGMHRLAERGDPRTTVLLDEGPLLISYQLFVYSDAPHTPEELEEFVRLVPMPDRIVHVRAPIEILVARAAGRSDPRRELVGRHPTDVRRSIARAVELFDELSGLEPIKDRMRTVEIDAGSDLSLDAAARAVADWIDSAPGDGAEPRT